MAQHVCAVDVGTRSARAGIFASDGRMLARAVCAFDVAESSGGRATYRFADLWRAACAAVRMAMTEAAVVPGEVAGLAFDATCSLVLTGAEGPLALDDTGHDTIAWYDHRAVREAAEITATGHPLIAHLGGAMSPEMQTAKLLWLKRQRPALWQQLVSARDLVDALTGKATGSDAASTSVLATKWPWMPAAGGWQHDLLAAIGLEDLPLPRRLVAPGGLAGRLTAEAAGQMGLAPGTAVACGMIDAYAGALGVCNPDEPGLCLIAGTSNCVMALHDSAAPAQGIWGPFRDAVLPGLWASEGGQSAAGAALDFIIDSWPGREGAPRPDHSTILRRIADLRQERGDGFAGVLHVLPDFNGNRSPFADPLARGVIHGVALDRSFDALCGLYWRTAVGIALGTRQVLEHMGAPAGATLCMGGGMALSDQMTQLFADATGRSVTRLTGSDSVLRGTALNAAVGAGLAQDPAEACARMPAARQTFTPEPEAQQHLNRDFDIFLTLQHQRDAIRALTG